VREVFGADPLDGSLFLFVNRRSRSAEDLALRRHGFFGSTTSGLEAGTFEVLTSDDACVEIDTTQLAMLLGGVSLVSAEKRRKRYRRAS